MNLESSLFYEKCKQHQHELIREAESYRTSRNCYQGPLGKVWQWLNNRLFSQERRLCTRLFDLLSWA